MYWDGIYLRAVFHRLSITPMRTSSKTVNEKYDGVSGSFTFVAMFVESLTEHVEVARQKVIT